MNSQATNNTSNSYYVAPPLSTFQSQKDIEIYLKNHAYTHGYKLTTLDSRKSFVTFKCSLGPNGHHKAAAKAAEAKNESVSIPTCPFVVSGQRDGNTSTWRVVIKNANHDHPPPLNLHPPSQDVSSHNSNQQSLPQSNQPLHDQYQALLSQMQTMPLNTQAALLRRFLSDCQLFESVYSNINPLNQTLATSQPVLMSQNQISSVNNKVNQDSISEASRVVSRPEGSSKKTKVC